MIQLNLEYHVLVTREFLVEHQSQKNKIDLNQSFYNQKSTQPWKDPRIWYKHEVDTSKLAFVNAPNIFCVWMAINLGFEMK